MKEIYLIRHAQSEMNLNPHIVGGRSNHTPLTLFGEKQAKELGEIISKSGLIPDFVFSSGAVRTNETARISFEEAGIKLDITISEDLQELHQGDSVGMDKSIVYDGNI